MAGGIVYLLSAESFREDGPFPQGSKRGKIMNHARRLPVCFLVTLIFTSWGSGCGGGDTTAVAPAAPTLRPEPPYAWSDPALPARLDAALEGWAKDFGYYGAAVAVSTPGWLSWAGSTGEQDIETHTAYPPGAQGRIASATKSFTASTVLQLVDEGRLTLDSTLAEFVPDYPNGGAITVEHLLRHRSGIPEIQLVDAYFIASILLFQEYWFMPEDILLWTYLPPPFPPILNLYTGEEQPREPLCAPGEEYHYSQPGYVALGLIIEKVTGQNLADVYRERIFEPLGLTGTHLPGPGEPLDPPGYTNLFGLLDEKVSGATLLTVSANSFYSASWSAGGLLSTARDLEVFLTAMLEGRLFSGEAMGRATDWMATAPGDSGSEEYGMGLSRSRHDGYTTVGHNGALPGGGSVMQYIPELDVYVGAVMNADADDVEAPDLVERVKRALRNEPQGAGG
jgi:D-alanyl-D-alanine carboxypeptidase